MLLGASVVFATALPLARGYKQTTWVLLERRVASGMAYVGSSLPGVLSVGMAAGVSIRHYLVGRLLPAINHWNTRGLASSFERVYLKHMQILQLLVRLQVPSSALVTFSAAAAHNFRRAIRPKIRPHKWTITKDRIEVAGQIILIWSIIMARKCEQAWH
jgi:hypothetical protein